VTAFHSDRNQNDLTGFRLWRDWGLPTIFALVLTPFALVVHHYKFVNDDQILYIPFLRRIVEPSLYPGDYFFDQAQANISLFEDVFVWPVRWLGLEWTMLIGYLIAQFAILLCLFTLARSLTTRRGAYLAMILFILPVSLGGTFVRTYDNYFNPRTFALPLSLLTLTALWGRKPLAAAILASLQLLLHPLSGLHVWLVSVLMLAWWAYKHQVRKESLSGAAVLLLGTLGLLVWNAGGTGGLWLDAEWKAVLWQRTPYVFLASWKVHDWISLGIYLMLGIVGWGSRRRDPRTTHLSLAVLVAVLGATLLVALGVDWLGLAPLAQLQIARSWRLVVVLAVVFGADLVFVLYERKGWGGWLVAALLAVSIYFDRADEEWQPVLALLLSAVLLSWIVARAWETRARWAAEGVLILAGLVLVIPALLALWPAAVDWDLVEFTSHWRLPDKAVWPAILLFGLLLVIAQLRERPGHVWTNWLRTGVGAALAVIALLPIANQWRGRDWPAYLNDRLQLPIGDAWMSPTFKAWRDVQIWAEGHTSPGARFATDPDEKGFRVFSGRSPIVEAKDGASAMFNRAYALEWDHRMQAMATARVVDPDKEAELTEFSEEGLAVLHRFYPFDYVVVRQSQRLRWPELYRNQAFVVYAWPVQE
jgi:hypothetical protein